MLAYAAYRPTAGRRESSPNALLLIVSAHIALLAVVMSAKMDLPSRIFPHTRLIDVPIPPPPPPPQLVDSARPRPSPKNSWIDHPVQQRQAPNIAQQPPIDQGGTTVDAGPTAGAGTQVALNNTPPIRPAPIHRDALLLTPQSDLKPPYPASKLASEEEATLHLRLTIDASGHVIAVEPVGPADRAFLDSARRYIIGHWRYQAATDDGRAIGSTILVTLRFQLDV